MALEEILVFLFEWLSLWFAWLRRRLTADTDWRTGPPGHEDLWRSTLRHNGASYVAVLRRFDAWCRRTGQVLDTRADVDRAGSLFVSTISKREGVNVLPLSSRPSRPCGGSCIGR